jgi:hypothetical protein
MTLSFEASLTEADRLEALRRLDQFRRWGSLDEKRYCLRCSKIINGWQVRIVSGLGESGPLRLVCPTESCESIPMDWVLPTDDVLAKMSILPNDAELAGPRVMEQSVPKNRFKTRLRNIAGSLMRGAARERNRLPA